MYIDGNPCSKTENVGKTEILLEERKIRLLARNPSFQHIPYFSNLKISIFETFPVF